MDRLGRAVRINTADAVTDINANIDAMLLTAVAELDIPTLTYIATKCTADINPDIMNIAYDVARKKGPIIIQLVELAMKNKKQANQQGPHQENKGTETVSKESHKQQIQVRRKQLHNQGFKLQEQSKIKNYTCQEMNGLELRVLEMQELNDIEGKIKRFQFGDGNDLPCGKLIFVGQTGSGKTTLVNSFINNLLGVNFSDSFRYSVYESNTKNRSESESQTDFVTEYTINYNDVRNRRCNFVFVDTPGLGDTRSVQVQKENTQQILNYISRQSSRVALVIHSSASTLTAELKSVLLDIKSFIRTEKITSLIILSTFATSNSSSVKKVLDGYGIQYSYVYLFNNNALYCKREGLTDNDLNMFKMSWDASNRSIDKVLDLLSNDGDLSSNYHLNSKKKTSNRGILQVPGDTKTSLVSNSISRLKKIDEKYVSILRYLGLEEVSTFNFGLEDLLKIKKSSLEGVEQLTLKEKLLYIISKHVMLDYRSRNIKLSIKDNPVAENDKALQCNEYKSELGIQDKKTESDSDDDDELIRMELSEISIQETQNIIHPSDVIVIIMNSCNDILRQILAKKMMVCQLAIPMILPNLFSAEPLFLLGTMRLMTMNLMTQIKGEKYINADDYSIPTVSAIRLGSLNGSKSKILNEIICHQHHNIFFHKDCESGNLNRMLSDGLVEWAWYLPGGNKEDNFDTTISFANLRADAIKYNKHFQFLSAVSSVMLVFLSTDIISDLECYPMLNELSTSNQQIVFIFLDAVDGKSYGKLQEIMNTKKFKTVLGYVKGQAKNASSLVTELRTKISKSLKKYLETVSSTKPPNLETISDIARSMRIIVDEDSKTCQDGKDMANIIMKELQTKYVITTRKEKSLPVQGKYWLEWAKLSKKQARLDEKDVEGKNHVKYIADLENKKEVCRREQCNLVRNMTPVMKKFINNLKLTKDNPETMISFMQWMKLYLDVISHKELPELQREYHSLWNDKQDQKNKVNDEEIKEAQNKLNEVERNLIASSFGLEHFMRELGQIYEAIVKYKDCASNDFETLNILPQLAADLLKSGFPLEIMDGDASHMPLTWIKAVLECLRIGLGDKKVYVISVLGVQSSGKSTLLNTMFGLNFSVSAGRCTKGVFAQLIAVEDVSSDKLNLCDKLMYDYILILDTEGLRAPELGESKLSHDNELATLVIGLGDVTIVNIKGENTAEIEDILQISVHAFLRMQLVNKNLKVKRSCYFVHQNVPAQDAATKMLYGYEKIQEQLDVITKVAAEQEGNASGIKCFKDVLEFDVKKNVWYFSNLWQGNPPMAPADPSYSEKVRELKTHLLNFPSHKDLNCLTFTDLQLRMSDLWKAILCENFVFSFKNSLELKSYQNLEEKYSSLVWNFRKEVKEMMHTYVNEILSCNEEDINSLHGSINVTIRTHIEETYTKLKKDLNTFFKASRDKEILVQWKSNTELRLLSLNNELRNEAKKNCESHFEVRRAHFVQKNKTESYKKQLEKKVKELVNTNAEDKMSAELLNEEFDKKWNEWMKMLDFDEIEEKDIRGDILTFLPQYFKNCTNLLKYEIAKYPKFEKVDCNPDASPSIDEEDYIVKYHILERIHHYMSDRKNVINHMMTKAEIKEFTNGLQREMVIFLRKNKYQDSEEIKSNDFKEKRTQDYDKTFIYAICNSINEKFQAFNLKNQPYELTIQYKIKVIVHILRNGIPIFKKMHRDYINENDPQHFLDKELKPTLRDFFVETVSQCKQEKTAASILITSLEKSMIALLKRELPQTIANNVKQESDQLFHAKLNLYAKVMEDLGIKSCFDDYKKFLDDPNIYLESWLKGFVSEYCSQVCSNGKSKLMNLVNEKVEAIISTLKKRVTEVNQSVEKEKDISFKSWLLNFHNIARITVPFNDDLFDIYGAQQVKDINYFEEWIIKGLEDIKASNQCLKNLFFISNIENGDETPPHKLLGQNILGCTEKCPFCYAICTLTLPDHACNHSTANHRPKAIGGYRDRATQEMILETCNMAVQGSETFCCRDSSCICWEFDHMHEYKEFQKVYSSWDITPDTSKEGQAYWKWVFCKFSKELGKHYDAKCPEIPDSWDTISWDEAKKSIWDDK